MREELADFDFGLTGLTERFHQDWRTGLTGTLSARDVVAESADYDARAILEDTLRVLHSSLPTWAVTALWHASTERNHDLDAVGTDGRAWLREIVDVCVERIKQDDPDFTAAVPVPAPDALTGAVLDEILIAGLAVDGQDHELAPVRGLGCGARTGVGRAPGRPGSRFPALPEGDAEVPGPDQSHPVRALRRAGRAVRIR